LSLHLAIAVSAVLAMTGLDALGVAASAVAQERRAIEVDARAIRTFDISGAKSQFGRLTFLGGLVLNSDDEEFGSLSGLDFDAAGRLHAVTDRGRWFSARLQETADRPTGLADAWIVPMLDPSGAVPTTKVKGDAEGLRVVRSGGRETALVSFEQVHEIRRFDLTGDQPSQPDSLNLPRFVRGLRANKGLEAIAQAPVAGPLGGSVVAIAERSLDRAGNHRGFVLDGPRAGSFAIARSDEFDITDAAFLPDGDLLLLERRFSFSRGLAIRLRLLRSVLIAPGRIVDGPILLEAGMDHQIDNLEGLAVRTRPDGRVILTLVSDDNHSLLQRTLLLQFALAPAAPPEPRIRPHE